MVFTPWIAGLPGTPQRIETKEHGWPQKCLLEPSGTVIEPMFVRSLSIARHCLALCHSARKTSADILNRVASFCTCSSVSFRRPLRNIDTALSDPRFSGSDSLKSIPIGYNQNPKGYWT
jgi:hypothetical protein